MMTTCRFEVKFKQEDELPEYDYQLINRIAKMGDYIYLKHLTDFFKIQRVLHHSQLNNRYPIVIKTNNPKYIEIYGTS